MRFIFYVALFYFIFKVIRFFQGGARKSIPRTENSTKKLSGVMVKDEVCQTYLPKEDAIREVKHGKEYFFCSRECQKKANS